MLRDFLRQDLKAVIVGTAVGTESAARGHYYAGPGNDFWKLLYQSGLTPELMSSNDDASLLSYGIGLSDLNKNVAQSHDRALSFDVEGFHQKMLSFAPAWVAFHGKTAANAYTRVYGLPKPDLGRQPWTVGHSSVFVLPQSSGANRRSSYDGRSSRLEWWAEFNEVIRSRSLG